MKALWKGKVVKVKKIITSQQKFVTVQLISQVKIEYKKRGKMVTDYVDGCEVDFNSEVK